MRSIFIFNTLTQKKIDVAVGLGFTTIITGYQNLSPSTFQYAKSKNLKIYVEVGIFQGEDLWDRYPDSRPVSRQGKLMEKVDWYTGVCPNHPQLRRDKLDLIKQIVTQYDIDGIWLDFIRYPCFWEEVRDTEIIEYCFCDNCISKFGNEVGGEPKGDPWITWKCQQVTDFVISVKNALSPKIELGLFAIPWTETDYNNGIKQIIGQDFRQLSKYIDIFSPMTYHRFTGNKTSWISRIVTYIAKITNKPILPLIQTEDRAGKISGKEFLESVHQATLPPSRGVVIFFLEDILRDHKKIKLLQA